MTDLIDRAVDNPFVGPRSIQAGQPLFGRDRERRDLLDSILAHRIVLLYSPSGAGKTSLLQAGLVQALEDEGVAVPRRPPPPGESVPPAPPVLIRVGLQASVVGTNANPYIASTVKAIDAALPPRRRVDDDALSSLELHDHLDEWHRIQFGGRDVCLIFDQFEELLVDQSDEPAKGEFLRQLGAFLGDQRPWPGDPTSSTTGAGARSRHRFAVFAMREDFLAQLDPYLALLPTGLRTRYRLNLLSVDAAMTAIRRPVGDRVEFDDAAAAKVVEDLSRVHVTRDGHVEEHAGRYVEPVQLQVVCRQLWERHHSAGIPGPVVVTEVAHMGSVDAALEEFYDEQVAAAARSASLAERDVREWFNGLITDRGLRAPVSTLPAGDDGRAVAALLDGHLLRREETRGTSWFELSHDRLVEPVRASNGRWFEDNLSLVESAARVWDLSSRPEALLLRDDVLHDGRTWAAEHPDLLGDVEHSFLDQSGQLQTRIDGERRAGKRLRIASLIAVAVGLVALSGLGFAVWQRQKAERAERDAETAAAEAESAAAEAESAAAEAESAEAASAWTSFSQAAATSRQSLLGALAASGPESEPPKLVRDQLAAALDVARSDVVYGSAAAISPDGREVAVANGLDGVRVFAVDSGKQLRFMPPRVIASDVLYSPDGRALALAQITTEGVRVTIVDAASGVEQTVLEAPSVEADRLMLAWSRDNSTLGVMDFEDEVVVWDVLTGRRLDPTVGTAVGISDDGQQIAVVRGENLDVVDRAGDMIQSFTEPRGFSPIAPAFSRDGNLIFAPLNDGSAAKLDVVAGTLQEAASSVGSAVLGQGLAEDGTLLWLDSGCLVGRAPPPYEDVTSTQLTCETQQATGSPFSGDGRRAVGVADESWKVWDVATGDEVFSHSTYPSAMAVGDDRVVVATNEWVTMRTGEGELVWEKKLASSPIYTIASGGVDGPLAIAVADQVLIVDAESGETLNPLAVETDDVNAISLSQQGDVLALLRVDGVELWDTNDEELIRAPIPDGEIPSTSVRLSSDGTVLAVGRSDGTVQVVSTGDGSVITQSSLPPPSRSVLTPPQGSSVQAVAAGTDGRVVFGDASGQVFTWTWYGDSQPEKVGDLGDTVIALDGNGESVAAVADAVLKEWTVDGEHLLLEYDQPLSEYRHVAIGEGGRVTTVGWDGLVSVHHREWKNLWTAARQFADDQGSEPVTQEDCEQLGYQSCPSRAAEVGDASG